MKIDIHLTFLASLLILLPGCKQKEEVPQYSVGLQTYTFNQYTLMETLDRAAQLGLHHAEAYFFQRLGEGFPDTAYLNYDLPEEHRILLMEELEKRNIRLAACGVAFYDSEDDWRRFFDFAQSMALDVVTAEPVLSDLDLVESLAEEYNIKVAIHNHPVPSEYADPSVLVEALEGRGDKMGVCADIGHWQRSGFDPLEALEKFRGKVMVLHMKDINQASNDTIWGEGILPFHEIISELKKSGFDGLISVEYENYDPTQMDAIRQSLDYLENHRI